MRALVQRAIPERARELLTAERLLLEKRSGLRRAAPYLALFVNLFVNGYLHPLLRQDPAGLPLALFFFLKCTAITGFFLLHYLTVSEALLDRIEHLPVGRSARFALVALGALRTPGIVGLLLTDLLFLVVVFGERAGVAAVAVCGMTFLVIGTIAAVAAASLGLRRSSYPVTALAALSALALAVLAASLIVFRASGLLPLVPLIWLATTAIGAALAGAAVSALVHLAVLGAVSGGLLYLGKKIA